MVNILFMINKSVLVISVVVPHKSDKSENSDYVPRAYHLSEKMVRKSRSISSEDMLIRYP